MKRFRYARPGSLDELYDLLDTADPGAVRPIVGGTDLIVGLRSGRIRPAVVVDLKHLADLPPGIRETGGRITISATTTLTDVIADQRIRARFPALVQAASTVGSVQIRNRASLTGNICNASPAYDTGPALLAHDAVIVLSGRAGQRRVPVAAHFARLTRRRGVDLATLSLCCAVTDRRTRLAFGAVAPRPFAVDDDSGVLADAHSTDEQRDEVLRAMTAQAAPITDVRGGADYRQAMLLVLGRRALRAALADRNGG